MLHVSIAQIDIETLFENVNLFPQEFYNNSNKGGSYAFYSKKCG
jgi:hypothetical protein